MAYNTPGYAERLRAHCSVADIERWKAAARAAGARNLSEWVRWVLDKESAIQAAATRNPWVDRKSGQAKQRELPVGPAVEIGAERKQKILRGLDTQIAMGRYARLKVAELAKESEGL
jgi:hypothetical protein